MCQRHLLANGAKQLPGKRVPLQRDAAELQGQFQGPASERGRERVGGRWDLSEQGVRGLLVPSLSGTSNTETKEVRKPPWVGVGRIIIQIMSEA